MNRKNGFAESHTFVVAVALCLIVLAGLIAMWTGLLDRVLDAVVPHRVQLTNRQALVSETKLDVDRIAAFATHTTCVSNRNVCAGPEAEWLATCAFLGSAKYTGATNTVNFRLAYTLVPDPTVAPYRATVDKPFYALHLVTWQEQLADIFIDSVMETIRKHGLQGDFDRIRKEVVVPFLDSGKDLASVPESVRPYCGRVVKLVRPELMGLEDPFVGWNYDQLLKDMARKGYVEVARVTDREEFRQAVPAGSTVIPGKTPGKPILLFAKAD